MTLRAVPKPALSPRKPRRFVKRVNAKRAAERRVRDFGKIGDWLPSLPCCISGLRAGQWVTVGGVKTEVVIVAAHVRSRGAGGRKDANLLPLASHLHDEQHRLGWPDFASRYGINPQEMAADYQRLFEERFGKE